MIKISVITAVYNSRETVSAALDSVLTQTHPDIEMVIVDGKSTDGTIEVLERYRPNASILISEPDKGIYDALNKGVRLCTGDVVGFLHADDLFADQDALTSIAAAFEDPAVDAVYGDLVYVRREHIKSIVREWRAGACTLSALRRGWMPPHPTFYVRRSAYERFGAFDTGFRIAADYDSIVRFLFVHGLKTIYVPRTLVVMRIGGISNRSLSNLIRKTVEDYSIVRRHALGGAWTVLQKNVGKIGQFWRRRF